MGKRIGGVVLALGMVIACTLQISAQQVVTFRTGKFTKLPAALLEWALGPDYQLAALTLPPDSQKAVFYLNGERVRPGQLLNRQEWEQVWMFRTDETDTITVGITGFPEQTPQVTRVRCINPVFQTHTTTAEQSQTP